MIMLNDHEKAVALRNMYRTEQEFYIYMRKLEWDEDKIREMWAYAQKKVKENERI